MTSEPLSRGERLVLAVGVTALSLLAEMAERLDQRDRRKRRGHHGPRPPGPVRRAACIPLLLAAIGLLVLRGQRPPLPRRPARQRSGDDEPAT